MNVHTVRLAVAAAIVAVGLAAVSGCVRGSGDIVTEERDIEEVDRVELSGIGRLEITQGDNVSLTVETDDNLMRYVRTESSDGTLLISIRSGPFPFIAIDPRSAIVYHLTVPDLSSVSLSGSGEIVGDRLETDELTIDVSGSGSVELADLDVDRFVYSLSGSGSATVRGRATRQEVEISGSGRLEAGELRSDEATIDINGSGRAIVWASERLEVDVSGSGDVQYYGTPEVDQEVSGSGSIESLGTAP